MAYQVGRASRVTESLELVDKQGNVVHTLPVELDVDKAAMEFNRRYNLVLRAEKAARAFVTAKEDEAVPLTEQEVNAANAAIEAFGESVISLFELIFGAEDAKTLLNFFDGRYFEMVAQTAPFVTDIVLPAMKKAAKEQQARLSKQYKLAAGRRK